MKKIDPRKVAYNQFDDPLEIEYLNSSLRRYFFIDYYDTQNLNDKLDEQEFIHIASKYNSYNEYLKDKINASTIINAGKAIPKELEQRLSTTKHELEQANKFEIYGRI